VLSLVAPCMARGWASQLAERATSIASPGGSESLVRVGSRVALPTAGAHAACRGGGTGFNFNLCDLCRNLNELAGSGAGDACPRAPPRPRNRPPLVLGTRIRRACDSERRTGGARGRRRRRGLPRRARTTATLLCCGGRAECDLTCKWRCLKSTRTSNLGAPQVALSNLEL
jgi:hypothetical protein